MKTDSHGNKTGQYTVSYGNPVYAEMNISAAKGQSGLEAFGINDSYSRVLVTDDMDCPIDTDSVVWIDRSPTDGMYDYRVVRVAKSLNCISYALQAVDVT